MYNIRSIINDHVEDIIQYEIMDQVKDKINHEVSDQSLYQIQIAHCAFYINEQIGEDLKD
jgi:hypothetical protein